MLMKSSSTCLFIFIFNLRLFEQVSYQYRRYVHVEIPLNWSLAQAYCRENHTDLATFRNELDAQQGLHNCTCWIGLQRDEDDPNVWKWSDGEESTFTHWLSGQPNDVLGVQEKCVIMLGTFWHDNTCNAPEHFLCYEDSILVKENKTWEEALEHCRSLETDSSSSRRNHRFDLRNFVGSNPDAKTAILDAQTPEVWIGLRFLAGEWLWLNGMPLREDLPACPAPGMYCGTMSKTGALWPMNCLERRNFFCSISD
ncbi:hypothetical protein VZT92_007736 [Zoarces viviparus]|uniref:C-type lectin domain-containing protein n=1 Tax=Zoarces viviparus TaxID=48416 RepID=A0AAW1FKE5_ZOAVI